MTPERLRELEAALSLPTLVLAALSAGLLWLLNGSKLPYLRFQRSLERREPCLWTGPEVCLALCFWFLSQIFFAQPFVALSRAGLLGKTWVLFGIQLSSSAASSWFVIHIVRRVVGQPYATIGFSRFSPGNLFPVLGAFLLSLFPLGVLSGIWTLLLKQVLGLEPQDQELVGLFRESVRKEDFGSIAALVMAGTCVAPFTEELIFRGFVFGWMRERWGTWIGATLSSLLFAAVHLSLTAFTPLFAVGCLLCWVYQRTGSLFPAMMFHALVNGLTFANILLGGGSPPG